MADLVAIECEPSPTEDVVAKLEEALEKARRGEISQIGIAIVYRNGASGTSFSRIWSFPSLIGSAQLLVARLCDRAMKRADG